MLYIEQFLPPILEAGLNTQKAVVFESTLAVTGATTLTGAVTMASTLALTGALTVGVDDTGHDVKFFGATAGQSWLWDESADKMIVTAASQFTGAVVVGVDGTGHDVQFFGDTASSQMLWDQSADNLILKGTAGLVCQSPTGDGIGYGTGAGGAVTQGSGSGRSTAVTLSKLTGQITTDTTSLAAEASAEFTVTNTQVALGDVIVCSQQSGSSNVAGTAGVTQIEIVTVAAGSFIISVNNQSSTTAETGAIIINFAVIKAVVS